MLRACNTVRIAHFPALRKDGARRRDGGGTGDAQPGGASPAPTMACASPAKLFIIHYSFTNWTKYLAKNADIYNRIKNNDAGDGAFGVTYADGAV
ncbi:MAG: hypothetical protein LBM98_05955 [Oscillospiraceae bacterium]|nr:hypothetical protein [Oscillospiraceae bacterium]